MDEPNEKLNEILSDKSMEVPPTDDRILLAAVQLKASLDDFRKTVLNALEQKRARNHIREPVWLNSREAQQMLRICSRTLHRYRKQNILGYRVVHKNYLYRYSEIIAFIERRNNCL